MDNTTQIRRKAALTKSHLIRGDRAKAEGSLEDFVKAVNEHLAAGGDGDKSLMLVRELAFSFRKEDLQNGKASPASPVITRKAATAKASKAELPKGLILAKGKDGKTNSMFVMNADGTASEIPVHRVIEEQA